jgi:hypothetical protein
MDHSYENVAIAHFFPHVAKEDIKPMAHGMHLHLLTALILVLSRSSPVLSGKFLLGSTLH